MYRQMLVEVNELSKHVTSIKQTTNEIVAIVPALITRGVVMKYLIIYGN